MPRIRSVHPDLCESDTMAGLTPALERTFVRLWTHCDDEGRCEDRPRIIKAGIYPVHDDMTWQCIDAELTELHNANLLVRYEVDGKSYIAIRSWGEYQHPQRPRPSKYPAPPSAAETLPLPIADDSQDGTRHVRDASSTDQGLELGVGEGEGEGGGETHTSSSPASLALVPAPVSPAATARADVHVVFDAWREATGKRKAQLDSKRRRRIELALREYPLDDVVDAVKGWRHSPFHAGRNDRAKAYNELDLLLRDAAHIEQFRDLERRLEEPTRAPTREPKAYDAIRRGLERRGSA